MTFFCVFIVVTFAIRIIIVLVAVAVIIVKYIYLIKHLFLKSICFQQHLSRVLSIPLDSRVAAYFG